MLSTIFFGNDFSSPPFFYFKKKKEAWIDYDHACMYVFACVCLGVFHEAEIHLFFSLPLSFGNGCLFTDYSYRVGLVVVCFILFFLRQESERDGEKGEGKGKGQGVKRKWK